VIYKSLFPVSWKSDGGVALLFTSAVTEDDLPEDALLSATPGIFQELLTKKYELRITVIGGHLFAAKLRSQEIPEARLDWRAAGSVVPVEPFDLPGDIADACLAVMKDLGIVFGCFDLVVRPTGEIFFLEVNEMGAFLWIEERLPEALSTADLLDVLSRLPDGLQSELGEGGVRMSGGQGQRVRLGRALLRRAPRLVLLDEPFRGLERDRRQALLRRSRAHWQGSTLLLVSHDVEDTTELDRVVVVEGGRIVEVGCPKALALDPHSRYSQKMAEARDLREACWQAAAWRRLSVAQGKLIPTGESTDGAATRTLA